AAVALLFEARSPATFVLAGVAAGLGIGAKVTLLAPVAVVTAGLAIVAARRRRPASFLQWAVPLVVSGAFWYVRNLVVAGNPVPGLVWTGGLLRVVAVAGVVGFLVWAATPASAGGLPGQPGTFWVNLRWLIPALALAVSVLPQAGPLAARRWRPAVFAVIAVAFVVTIAVPS